MRILQFNPIEVKSYTGHCKNVTENCILIGKCNDGNYYSADLLFQPIILSKKEILIKAVLRMFCKTVCDVNNCIPICINRDNVSLAVRNMGIYEWDVTNFFRYSGAHSLRLYAYTKHRLEMCDIKEFEVSHCEPVLELIVEGSNDSVDIVEEYMSTDVVRYANWVDCRNLNRYYYFIHNLGNSEVEVFVEISPNAYIVYEDSGPFIIAPGEVSYIQPMRECRFVRISYSNTSTGDVNAIKVWFQSKD